MQLFLGNHHMFPASSLRGFGEVCWAIDDQNATKTSSLRYKALYIADAVDLQFILTKGRRHTAGAIVLRVDDGRVFHSGKVIFAAGGLINEQRYNILPSLDQLATPPPAGGV